MEKYGGRCQVSVGDVKKCWEGCGEVLGRYGKVWGKCEEKCGGCKEAIVINLEL